MDVQFTGAIMKKTTGGRLSLIIALALGAWAQAHAQSQATQLNYNEIGLGFHHVQTRGGEHETYHGTGLSGRYLVNENWFITGSLDRISNQTNATAHKDLEQSIGVGFRYGLSATTDLLATLQYNNANETISKQSRTNHHETAYGVGIRSLVTPLIELNASVNSHQPQEGGSYVSYNTGVGLHVSNTWVLRGMYSNQKYAGIKTDAYTISVGYKF